MVDRKGRIPVDIRSGARVQFAFSARRSWDQFLLAKQLGDKIRPRRRDCRGPRDPASRPERASTGSRAVDLRSQPAIFWTLSMHPTKPVREEAVARD